MKESLFPHARVDISQPFAPTQTQDNWASKDSRQTSSDKHSYNVTITFLLSTLLSLVFSYIWTPSSSSWQSGQPLTYHMNSNRNKDTWMREVIISTHIFLEHLVRSALCPLMRMRRHLDFVVTTKLSDGQHTSQSQYTPSITLSSFLIIPTKIDRNVGPSSSWPLLLLLSRQSIFTI